VVQVPADDVEALASLMAEHGDTVAAVLTEPVQGAAGIYPPQDGYLESLRKLCDQHGAYLIFDEVITGYGRLGSWFAAHHFGVRPDLVTFAKAVTSGYQPLGGVFVGPGAARRPRGRPRLLPASRVHLLGPPRGVRGRSGEPGDPAPRGPGRARHPRGRAVERRPAFARRRRGDRPRPRRGCHVGCGPAPGQNAMAIRDDMLRRGVICRAINTDTLTFCPPLVITDEQIGRIVDAVAAAAAG
jgi:putrescine aminotransferase